MTLAHVYALVSISLGAQPVATRDPMPPFATRELCLAEIKRRDYEPGVVMILDRAALVCVQTTKEDKP